MENIITAYQNTIISEAKIKSKGLVTFPTYYVILMEVTSKKRKLYFDVNDDGTYQLEAEILSATFYTSLNDAIDDYNIMMEMDESSQLAEKIKSWNIDFSKGLKLIKVCEVNFIDAYP